METLVEFLLYLQAPLIYLIAFLVLLACGFGLPLPEDVTLFAMGLLSYYGLVDFRVSVAVCFAGVMIGDSTVFFLGRRFGPRIATKGALAKFFHPERMDRTRELLMKWGNKVIFAARFMPGLRTPMFFSAGTFRLPFRVFFFYDGMAALLSVPLLVGAVYYFGDHVDRVIQIARKAQHGMVLAIVAIVLILFLKHYLGKRRAARRSRPEA